MQARYGARVVGVDFKDLSRRPEYAQVEFHCGLFYEQDVGVSRAESLLGGAPGGTLLHAVIDQHASNRERAEDQETEL